MSTDSCCDFLGACVYRFGKAHFIFSWKHQKMRQNLQYSSLKYTLRTHLFHIQFLILSSCVWTAEYALLDRRWYFEAWISDLPESLSCATAGYWTAEGSKAWLSIHRTFSFFLSIQHQENLHTVNARDIFVRIRAFVCAWENSAGFLYAKPVFLRFVA